MATPPESAVTANARAKLAAARKRKFGKGSIRRRADLRGLNLREKTTTKKGTVDPEKMKKFTAGSASSRDALTRRLERAKTSGTAPKIPSGNVGQWLRNQSSGGKLPTSPGGAKPVGGIGDLSSRIRLLSAARNTQVK